MSAVQPLAVSCLLISHPASTRIVTMSICPNIAANMSGVAPCWVTTSRCVTSWARIDRTNSEFAGIQETEETQHNDVRVRPCCNHQPEFTLKLFLGKTPRFYVMTQVRCCSFVHHQDGVYFKNGLTENHQISYRHPYRPSLQPHQICCHQILSIRIDQSLKNGRKCRLRRFWVEF